MAEWQHGQPKYSANGSPERRHARWAKKEAYPSRRAEEGKRIPEWQCSAKDCAKRTFVWTRGGELSQECRNPRCQKPVDQAKDDYINEWGQKSAWPALCKRMKPPQNKNYSPGSQLNAARKQVQTAIREGFPPNVLELMQADVTRMEREEREHRPLGQRLDQSRAQLRRAVEAAEQADDTLRQAQLDMADAAEEVENWHAEVQKLTFEARLLDRPTQTDIRSKISPIVQQLAVLAQAVEATWLQQGGPPPDRLTGALKASHELIEELSAMEPNEEETAEGDSAAQVVRDDESMDDTQLYVNTAEEVFEEEQRRSRGEVKRQPDPNTDAPPSKRRETKKELSFTPAPRSYAEAVGSTSGSSDAQGSKHAGGKAITPDARLKETLSRARRFIRPMSEVMSKDRERSPRREGGEEERA